jgi:hypothetical protein
MASPGEAAPCEPAGMHEDLVKMSMDSSVAAVGNEVAAGAGGTQPPDSPPPPPPPQQPRHLQQLTSICDQLHFHRQQDLAWVPECMDAYMRTALGHAACPTPASPAAAAPDSTGGTTTGNTTSAGGSSPPPAASHIIALGSSEHVKGTGAKAARWVAQVGLVVGPSTSPPAAAAGRGAPVATGDEGPAPCRLLVIEDAAPAPLGKGLKGALLKGCWPRFGLQLSGVLPAEDESDETGGLGVEVACMACTWAACSHRMQLHLPSQNTHATNEQQNTTAVAQLETLPGIPEVPLALLVCSRTLFHKADDTAPTATAATDANPTATDAPAATATRGRRGPPRAPELSGRAEAALFSKALAAALEELKGQLPPGYLLSKAQVRVASCLPAIAESLSCIVRHAVNPQLKHYACSVLACQTGELEGRLLSAMTAAADAALCPAPVAAAEEDEGLNTTASAAGGGGVGGGRMRGAAQVLAVGESEDEGVAAGQVEVGAPETGTAADESERWWEEDGFGHGAAAADPDGGTQSMDEAFAAAADERLTKRQRQQEGGEPGGGSCREADEWGGRGGRWEGEGEEAEEGAGGGTQPPCAEGSDGMPGDGGVEGAMDDAAWLF